MSDRPICKKCSRPITGIIKIDTTRRKLGKKSILQSDYYDEDCFYTLNKEQAMNDFQKNSARKKANKK